jgi:hypothetical protein
MGSLNDKNDENPFKSGGIPFSDKSTKEMGVMFVF